MDTIKGWYARLTKRTSSAQNPDPAPDQAAARDFAQERETGRGTQMSAEDRAWETESRARDQANTARKPSSDTE